MQATKQETEFQLKHNGKVDVMPATIARLRTLLYENESVPGLEIFEGILELLEDLMQRTSDSG